MVENIRTNRDISIEKYWRILLEGVLFEGRCDNKVKARPTTVPIPAEEVQELRPRILVGLLV